MVSLSLGEEDAARMNVGVPELADMTRRPGVIMFKQ
jgi:hypothetical protein